MGYRLLEVTPYKRIEMESALMRLKSHCENYKDISDENFMKCAGNVYVVKYNGELQGLIAARRVFHDEVPEELALYHPMRNGTAYLIEALHIDPQLPEELALKLVETCLNEKNDGFVFMEVKCPTLKEELLEKLHFKTQVVTDKTYYIRAPKTYSLGDPVRKLYNFSPTKRNRDG